MFSRLLPVVVAVALLPGTAAAQLRDPTAPPRLAKPLVQKQTARLKLTTIIRGGARELAIINGRAYGIGEGGRDFRLLSLTADTALVRRADGTLRELKMNTAVVKKERR